MAEWVPVATKIVHFTGYEVQFDPDPARRPARSPGRSLDRFTGDLIAQMSDRCYLEKCRDRLYPEFVLGGIAMPSDGQGNTAVKYSSGPGRAATHARVHRRSEALAPRRRVRRRLSRARSPVQRPQPIHGSDSAQSRLLGRGAALGSVADAASRSCPAFTWEKNPVQNIRARSCSDILKQVLERR